jgi:hypothetical protein
MTFLVPNRDGDFDDRIRERIERQGAAARLQTEWTPPSGDPLDEVRIKMGWKPKRKRSRGEQVERR